MVEPLDARLNANYLEEELVDGEPLGLANPLLPLEPLGQNLLSPQFLMPVAAEPLMATNPSMLFPGGIPGYQPPKNLFQESPFFAEAHVSPKMGEALVLPEVLQGSRSVPRPSRSDQLDDLESQTNFKAPAESPEPTSNEVEIAEVPTLEKDFEGIERREIQPVLVQEVELPTSPEVERKEFVEALPETELSSSFSESSFNPLSVPAVSEENYVADALPSESIAAELSLQKTELVEPTVAFASASEELGSPTVAQPESAREETEPAVVPELPKLIGQPSDVEVPASPETEPAQGSPETIATASSPPSLAEEIITSAPETISPEPEPLSTSSTATSVEGSNLNLKQIAPEAEEIPESPDFTAVQNAAEAVQPTPLAPENLAPSETLEAITSEELSSVTEPAREETKPLPKELSNEAPIVLPEEAASKIAETPISNPEIIAAEREEPVTESTLSLAEPEVAPFIPAKSEPVEELESPEPLPVSEPLQTPEQPPHSEEHIDSPGDVIPAIEPLVAAQNLSEGVVSSEPIAATAQEMAVPETLISLQNEPETVSPPISRTQELIDRQIEAFSGLEQEELEEETVPSAPTVPTVNEENTPKTAVEENAPLEIPALESVATTTAESTEIKQVERPSLQNEPVSSETPAEESTEEFTPRSNPPESLGIITPLIAAPPLAQLSNFLPITSEPFSSERITKMPLGLEQPMTVVSPNNFRPSPPQEQQPLVPPVAIPESGAVINLSVSESIEENVPTTSQEIDNPKNEPTETISASPQEEPPSQSEKPNSLSTGIALPIQLNEESFRPFIFAPRPPISAQTDVQKTPASDFSPSPNRATEERHEATSFMPSHSSEVNEEQGSTFISMASEWGGEHVASHKEGHEISTGETGGRELHKPELEAIAQEIYGLLRQRLEIERERQGHYSGRLPW